MHDKLMKMIGKKRDLSDHEKKAKMDVIREMKDEASRAMNDRMGHLKKVSVMSDSPEGLQHGLEKAHDIIGDSDEAMYDGGAVENRNDSEEGHGEVASDEELEEMGEDAEDAGADVRHAAEEHEGEEPSDDEEAEEHPEMSHDEIDAQIAKLQEMKKLAKK